MKADPPRRSLLLVTSLVVAIAHALPASAANWPAARSGDALEVLSRPDPRLVRRIQRMLIELGLYRGVVDGRAERATDAAVRAFQARIGVEPDGRISDELAARLTREVGRQALSRRLDRARRTEINSARRALLSSRATRRFAVAVPDASPGATRSAQDPEPCFRRPSARCLLAEAVDSASHVSNDELRNWAFGEIVVVQARAGLIDEALATLQRIGDPRLTLVGLRDIAEAQAAAGRTGEAFETARIIPDRLRRAEALGGITAAQIRRGGDAAPALREMARQVNEIDDPLKRVALHARAAVLAARARAPDSARRHVAAAERLARTRLNAASRQTALRHVAMALTELKQPGRAISLMDGTGDATALMPVLVQVASAQAWNGDAAKALVTVRRIGQRRYRAAALAAIAVAEADRGRVGTALQIIDRARHTAERVRASYARSYALSRVALAVLDIAKDAAGRGLDKAEAIAGEIGNEQLRATVLWSVAAGRRRVGDGREADRVTALAEQSTAGVRSPLSRVWLLGDVVERQAALGQVIDARRAFEQGLAIGRHIDAAWARARAVTRLASALTSLNEADRNQRD